MGKRLCRLIGRHSRGQGLVEMALALPVLLILLLGLVELAFLLRAYLVVYNADREASRFGARGPFDAQEIADRAMTSFSGQLPVTLDEAEGNTIIYVTRLQIPVDEKPNQDYHEEFKFGTFGDSWPGGDPESKIDPQEYWADLKEINDQFNQKVAEADSGLGPTSQEVIVVEIMYEHDQVLHAPVIEWFLPDPMVVYAWTTMRIVEGR